jgi:23S rRNA pseudouridine1911/1915/1917 synthase
MRDIMNYFELKITKKQAGHTIYEFLEKCHLGKKRRYLLRDKLLVNHQPVNQNYLLQEGDLLQIEIADFEGIDFIPSANTPEVLYEDPFILVINKNPNIIIYPEYKTEAGTLVNDVANYYKQKGINRTIRHIHRLDRDTSGVILFAKDMITQAYLSFLLEQNKIIRKYIGYIKSSKIPNEGEVDLPISGDRHINGKMITNPRGQYALTKYKTISRGEYFSIVEFKLETGRTHQIRVHMAAINSPLLGDTLYGQGSQLISRPALHSAFISFMHPYFDEEVKVYSQLPKDMAEIINESQLAKVNNLY